MNINLGTQWEEFIAAHLQGGRYLSASEVVRDGLRLLQEREQMRQARLDQLRTEVDKGLEQLDRGEYIEVGRQGLSKHLARVKTQGRQRLAIEKQPAK